MLPSSYTRRLRTRDLIYTRQPGDLPAIGSKSSSRSFARVNFTDTGTRVTHSYLPYLNRERTKTYHCSRVSGQINMVLERLSENEKKEEEEELVYKKKLNAVFVQEKRDTPVPPKMEKQKSRLSDRMKGKPKLKTIKEKKEKLPPIVDTVETLTRERMIRLANILVKDKRLSQCYKRNTNKVELLRPIIVEGLTPWAREVKSDVVALVPIKTIRYIKWKYKFREIGYLEIELPKKIPRRQDIYEPLRADDGIHLSTSNLNKALVEVFQEGLRLAKMGEYSLVPSVDFDYMNDTIELVFTKHLRIPLIPAIFLSPDEPLYVLKPNLPDLDPTSDTLFRACFLEDEERILSKISSTDHGLRFDALKVIHTLCKQDWRLQALTVYQLKTVLMHDMDFEIDHSPRWQRLTRDICVQSILKRLLYFVKKQTLPHFFQSEINLFRGISEKYLNFMQLPLQRLVSNEPQLMRDLQRASRNDEDSDTSSESDEDWW